MQDKEKIDSFASVAEDLKSLTKRLKKLTPVNLDKESVEVQTAFEEFMKSSNEYTLALFEYAKSLSNKSFIDSLPQN